MDFINLVKNSDAYNEKNLKPNDKEFVNGMKYVLENDVNEFVSNYCYKSETILEKINEEVVSEAIEELKKYISGSIAEVIVSIIDGYDEDSENI